jgi:hypothetical protein
MFGLGGALELEDGGWRPIAAAAAAADRTGGLGCDDCIGCVDGCKSHSADTPVAPAC